MSQIVLIGAGSHQFGFDSLGDIFQCAPLKGSRIVLHDINPESLEFVRSRGQEFIEANKLPFTLEAQTDRKKALAGAEFVIISIETGNRFELWEQDRTIPQQFGVNQIYGENGGVGGIFHALRITPPILEICEDIQNICPDAYVFNFSNPMTKICTAVRRKYPQMKFYGICHEIASLERYLPSVLELPWNRLETMAGGLNHFSFLLEVRDKKTGKDLYPEVRSRAPEYFKNLPGYTDYLNHYRKTGELRQSEGSREQQSSGIEKISADWADRNLFRIFLQRFGYLPVTTDSHLGEYIAWAYDCCDHRGIIDFLQWYRIELADMKNSIQLVQKEQIVSIISAIVTNQPYTEGAVNLPNDSLISGLPQDLIVETPAEISADGIKGVPLKDYPKSVKALLANQVAVNDLTAEAVLTGSRACVEHAVLSDPVVTKISGIDQMVSLFCENQRPYLDYLTHP